MNLSPILTTPKPLDRGGRRGQLHDCGKYGKLSVGQIARIAGVTTEAIRHRVNTGVKGAALCAPYKTNYRRTASCRNPSLIIAVKLATAFPHRAPTTEEIRKVHPMSRTAATRWRSAFRDVMDEEAA